MAKTKDLGHNFSKLRSANFPLFLSAKVFKIRIAFCQVFDANLKTVVSENNECRFNVSHVSSYVDYIPQRYCGNKAISALTRVLEME